MNEQTAKQSGDEIVTSLIERANFHLSQMEQWATARSFHLASKSESKAEAVIEMLEILHIGSVGGVDDGQKWKGTLRERLDWVNKKLKDRYSL